MRATVKSRSHRKGPHPNPLPKGEGTQAHNRRGQALVEFAVVSLVVYMLLAAILTFGQLLYCAQTQQQAADVAAREISRTPLPATADLMDVLYSSDPQFTAVRQAVFDPQLLQFDLSTVPAGQSILDTIRTWPIVNQMLYPLMIPIIPPGQTQARWLSYPGVVPCTDSSGPNRTVYCVARVDSRAASGAEAITWVPVIEEITPGAFSVASTQGGLVSLRINLGYQSASMSAYPSQTSWPPAAHRKSDYCRRRPSDDQRRELYADRHAVAIRNTPPTTGIKDWDRNRRGERRFGRIGV